MHNLLEHAQPAAAAVDVADVAGIAAALQQVLASNGFCRAQRMRRLLRFLVDKRLHGAVRDTSEYVIGIEVFDRDPSMYHTGEDPIVRVQIGRLRDKLNAYYAGAGAHAPLRFSIPIGSYMPDIQSMPKLPSDIGKHYLLAVAPLAFFHDDPAGAAFTRGLDEELAYHLYQAFGPTIVSHTVDRASATGTSHWMEGSVRAQGDQLRITIRLVDRAAGCIVWSEQFNYCAPFGIALQEQVAGAVCAALKQYFALG